MATPSRRLSAGTVLVALGAGIAALAASWAIWPGREPWAAAGWLSLTVVGLVESFWLRRHHGRPGSVFLVAALSASLARLVLVGGGTAWALAVGGNGLGAFLTGAIAGFVPLMSWEIVGFVRAARA